MNKLLNSTIYFILFVILTPYTQAKDMASDDALGNYLKTCREKIGISIDIPDMAMPWDSNHEIQFTSRENYLMWKKNFGGGKGIRIISFGSTQIVDAPQFTSENGTFCILNSLSQGINNYTTDDHRRARKDSDPYSYSVSMLRFNCNVYRDANWYPNYKTPFWYNENKYVRILTDGDFVERTGSEAIVIVRLPHPNRVKAYNNNEEVKEKIDGKYKYCFFLSLLQENGLKDYSVLLFMNDKTKLEESIEYLCSRIVYV